MLAIERPSCDEDAKAAILAPQELISDGGTRTLYVDALRFWATLIVPSALTIGIVPVVIFGLKYALDQFRWRKFDTLIQKWAEKEFEPEALTEEQWKALAATMLYRAYFEPARVSQLLDLAVSFAKGRASQEIRGRI